MSSLGQKLPMVAELLKVRLSPTRRRDRWS